jgi:Acetyltransferases
LAFQAGLYCRFNTDPNLPQTWFLKIYSKWIENSVNGSIATRVIVIRHDNKIIGMATLGTKNARGDIGLLAVNPNFRGKKLGTKLVYAAQAYFIEQGFSRAQVVTQKINLLACKLYEKCGFHQEKIENFYHFWL